MPKTRDCCYVSFSLEKLRISEVVLENGRKEVVLLFCTAIFVTRTTVYFTGPEPRPQAFFDDDQGRFVVS